MYSVLPHVMTSVTQTNAQLDIKDSVASLLPVDVVKILSGTDNWDGSTPRLQDAGTQLGSGPRDHRRANSLRRAARANTVHSERGTMYSNAG